MEEIWVDIKGYEGIYQVSNLGRVKNVQRNKIRKLNSVNGYYQITLSKNGVKKNRMVHRLVLENFCPVENMENLQVNHIDENGFNNCLTNLEWLTAKENVNYGTGIARRAYTQKIHNSRAKPIQNMETGEEYISIRECSRITGIDKASLARVLNGTQHTAGGYHWEYI